MTPFLEGLMAAVFVIGIALGLVVLTLVLRRR